SGGLYARVIKDGSSPSLRPFFHDHIDKNAEIKTDEWRGYRPLKATFPHLTQIASGKKGEHFPQMHRAIMMFKAWLRGTHHAVEHLQAYLDEYCYRFNRHLMKGKLFDRLMDRMVAHSPVYCKNLTIY
ncbi:MAG: IS1595 family transposase, partial [Bacteroidota bacterium]